MKCSQCGKENKDSADFCITCGARLPRALSCAQCGHQNKLGAAFCIHCGLCVRYCAEVKGKHAVGFIDRGVRREISFLPEIAARECPDCKECFPLCPTSYLQAAFVLVEALAFPPSRE